MAIGASASVRIEEAGQAFEELERFLKEQQDWAFGHLSYELKDELENLRTRTAKWINFPALHFFRPKLILHLKKDHCLAEYLPEALDETEVRRIYESLARGGEKKSTTRKGVELEPGSSRASYLKKVQALQEHIQKGDIYEANFCQEFFSKNIRIDPYATFLKLQELAKAPMGAFYKLGDAHLLCASPERYLRILNGKVLAQPIKGTAPRGRNEEEDRQLAEQLSKDPKERAENVMIVDLVRNDLSRTAERGSVEVEELCGVHPFPTVHQMISSIRSKIAPECNALDVIRSSFPMGSMTGAPKVRAMELIEAYEEIRRGLYSGAVGYVDPEGNWDLNVVIRSLLYDEKESYLSAMVGGAITARSDPEKEYEECLLKAAALKRAIA